MATLLTVSFIKGSLVRLSAAFTTNETVEVPVDPTTITARVKTPGAVTTAYVYGTDVSLIKDSVGLYHLDISASEVGSWWFRWEGTGAGQSAAEHSFKVAASQFS